MSVKKRFLFINKLILSRYAPVGGQAVIEGVMMRSPRMVATAVQRASGDITLESFGRHSDNPWLIFFLR